MARVIITADSTCDLSPELYEKYQVKRVPLLVTIGEENYFDCVDAFPEDIYAYVEKTKILPKTAARSIGDYIDFFKPFVEAGDEVVHISISAGFSSSYQNACLAAEELGNTYVVDSRNLSTGSGHIVLEAAIKALEGQMNGKEIADYASSLTDKVDASFVLDALDYLHKGGRCSGVAVLGANLLKLKPCIKVVDGGMVVGKKYRGNMKEVIKSYVKDRLTQPDMKVKKDRIFVTHTRMSEEWVNAAKEAVESLGMFDEIIETTAGCTITSHCGPNTLGVLFIHE